jgi:hypothetical protein
MRKIVFGLVLSLILISCNEGNSNRDASALAKKNPVSYKSFGTEITAENALSATQALEKFNSLEPGDTLNLKFSSKIKSVCKKKGCWIILELPEQEVRVSFKEYGFFVPKDSENTEVIVEGKAFLNEISVEDQKHYAQDEGKPHAGLSEITMPKTTKAFIAEAVLLKE